MISFPETKQIGNHMSDKRQLLIGGVYQQPGRVKSVGPLMVEICNELEPHLQRNKYVDLAPFEVVSLIFRFGKEDSFEPEIGSISKAHNELPVAITFDVERLKTLDLQNLRNEFRLATIDVLCDIAANYDLPYEFLDNMRIQA